MTVDEVVEDVMQREGRVFSGPPTNDQPTGPGGITLPRLTAWRGRPCTVKDLQALTVEEARRIVQADVQSRLRVLRFDQLLYEPLRVQMLDFAHQSGAERAVRWLQRTVGMSGVMVTGIIDERTIANVNRATSYGLIATVNNALAAERAHFALAQKPDGDELIQDNQKYGVLRRAVSFVVPLAT